MASDDKLPEDVVIADLLDPAASRRLRDPFKYVVGVYGTLREHGWQTPGLRVRIGREGTGAQPYYRIEKDEPDGATKILGFYHGQGHTRFKDTFNIQDGSTWSSRTTSYGELRSLHDHIKNVKA